MVRQSYSGSKTAVSRGACAASLRSAAIRSRVPGWLDRYAGNPGSAVVVDRLEEPQYPARVYARSEQHTHAFPVCLRFAPAAVSEQTQHLGALDSERGEAARVSRCEGINKPVEK